MKTSSDIPLLIALLIAIIILFGINLRLGDVQIHFNEIFNLLTGGQAPNKAMSYIVENRLNRSIVAIFAGGSLAISGLILQVFFRNPLAGPGVLGITSGASLGAAVVILGGATLGTFVGGLGIVLAGIIGALVVLALLLLLSRYIYNSITLLVAGLMFSFFTSALINILFLWANESDTRQFVIWGLGSFEGFTNTKLIIFITITVFTSCLALFLIKPLNALVIGPAYASSLGVNLKKTRLVIILLTGILAAVVTVYCGPVGFIGIAVPQLMNALIKSKNHAQIVPLVFLGGALLALLADVIVRLSGSVLPLNTVTALIGAPIIIWIIIKMNRRNAAF